VNFERSLELYCVQSGVPAQSATQAPVALSLSERPTTGKGLLPLLRQSDELMVIFNAPLPLNAPEAYPQGALAFIAQFGALYFMTDDRSRR
jgi:hypothetical protein